MKKLATPEIMRKLDRIAIEKFGIPSLVLMENAARGTVQEMFRHFPHLLKQLVGLFGG
jgi:NAD(P)H-hydrate repair Nnr-like enzyme with NAD(P)H-hydrate epimerase domain